MIVRNPTSGILLSNSRLSGHAGAPTIRDASEGISGMRPGARHMRNPGQVVWNRTSHLRPDPIARHDLAPDHAQRRRYRRRYDTSDESTPAGIVHPCPPVPGE